MRFLTILHSLFRMTSVKIAYAGEDASEACSQKVKIFLGGATNLGNSWRPEAIDHLVKELEGQSVGIVVPEPRDSKILTWADFYKTQPKGYDQVKWEMRWNEKCQIWSMYMPLFVNKFQAGDLFAAPASSAERSHPIAVKALRLALESKEISQSEHDEALLKLTPANLGCQVRFEAGWVANRCREGKLVVVWGKSIGSQQISFEPYLGNDTSMHILSELEQKRGSRCPNGMLVQLVDECLILDP